LIGSVRKKIQQGADIFPDTISRRHMLNIPDWGAGICMAGVSGAATGHTGDAIVRVVAHPNVDRVSNAIIAQVSEFLIVSM
jgi:hypothetical protein